VGNFPPNYAKIAIWELKLQFLCHFAITIIYLSYTIHIIIGAIDKRAIFGEILPKYCLANTQPNNTSTHSSLSESY
jgi:hypothetical protein